MKAIETRYKGYRFRSRLEARWAVFFDAMGIEWVYEPEGFDLGNGVYYLPDFYLPKYDAWIEIKPKNGSMNEVRAILISMIENGPSAAEKAWGFFGDPLDHYWMMPCFYSEPQARLINGAYVESKPAGWRDEWVRGAAIEFDEELGPVPGFGISGAERLEKDGYGIKENLIGNYREKAKARAARFEHGERG